MDNQRGNHWKRRVVRQIVSLGTIPSLLAGALLAAPPAPPGLPGLPAAGPTITSPTNQPQLLPILASDPASGMPAAPKSKGPSLPTQTIASNGPVNSAVNIKILPGLPAAGSRMPSATELAAPAALGQEKGTVMVKMQDFSTNQKSNPATGPLTTSYVTSSVTVMPSTPITFENDKFQGSGPVKLSFDDNGIVDLGVQRPRQQTVINSRPPELVKPKKYSVAQPVVLAQAAEIPSVDEPSSAMPAVPNLLEPNLIELKLPVPLAQTPSVDELQPDQNATFPSSIQLAEPATEEVSTKPVEPVEPISQLQIASSDPQATPNTPKLPEASETSPTAIVNPTIQLELGLPQFKTKVGEGQNEALRQYAINHKPERSYDIESRSTYAIDMPFAVASTSSLHSDICTVFKNGNSITIAGGTAGNTRVAIVSQTGETRVIEVNVLPVGQQFSRPQSDIDQVKELIGKVFPDARVQIVSLPTGEVEVKGTTSSESDARKILELVRKVCLVPVHDRLKSGR
ncbi:MAG: hypothetical protein ACK5YR_04505 [Pirellula sp.]